MSNFEVRMDGHRFLTVQNGQMQVDGLNFHDDLEKLARLSSILDDILETASTLKKPRLVSGICIAQDAVPGSSPQRPRPVMNGGLARKKIS